MQGCDNWDIRVLEYQGKEQVVLLSPDRHTGLQQECTDDQTSQTNEHWVDELYK